MGRSQDGGWKRKIKSVPLNENPAGVKHAKHGGVDEQMGEACEGADAHASHVTL